MDRIAKFHKVSKARFLADWRAQTGCDTAEAQQIYEGIQLPRRATAGSAGYDFFAPQGFSMAPRETVCIPTGIRVEISEGWVLQLYPRSGLGVRYRLQLNNTVGIIDSDYCRADNEGHIFIKMIHANPEGKTLHVSTGSGFAQGVFVPFGLTVDDDAAGDRHGGFGSTTK